MLKLNIMLTKRGFIEAPKSNHYFSVWNRDTLKVTRMRATPDPGSIVTISSNYKDVQIFNIPDETKKVIEYIKAHV